DVEVVVVCAPIGAGVLDRGGRLAAEDLHTDGGQSLLVLLRDIFLEVVRGGANAVVEVRRVHAVRGDHQSLFPAEVEAAAKDGFADQRSGHVLREAAGRVQVVRDDAPWHGQPTPGGGNELLWFVDARRRRQDRRSPPGHRR